MGLDHELKTFITWSTEHSSGPVNIRRTWNCGTVGTSPQEGQEVDKRAGAPLL